MPTDYEDIYDIEDLDDDELKQLILGKVRDEAGLDAAYIEVDVTDGEVHLGGRVGTEDEAQLLEEIVEDELGIGAFQNEVVVDESVRAESPQAADESAAQAFEAEGELGGESTRTEPSAEHLAPDTAHEQRGTHDMKKAIERGESYSPPDSPPQVGSRSRENH